ncbi:MAG: ABC transporter permease [Desulfurococcales archaeon]|nr:ABC transporter permease [Desulfurococcales archaeon]
MAPSQLKRLLLIPLKYREVGVVTSIIVFAGIFYYLNEQFASPDTLASIATLAAELGIIAVGVSFLMIAGEFDLSVGAVFAASSMLAVWMLNNGYSFPEAVIAALGLGAAVGLANAAVTLIGRIPSFIATLGMMWMIRGVLLAITKGFPMRLEVEVPELSIFSAPIAGDLRVSAVWFLALAGVFHFILVSTAFGNWIQAVGGSPATARALGVNVNLVKTVGFVVSGMSAALAGLIAMSRFKVVEPVAGVGLELEAIASAVIGGCSLTGGVGTVAGAALAAFLVSEIRTGLILAGAPAYWYIGFMGFLLIVVGIINLRVGKVGVRYG